jgi:hypothetical protein
VLASPSRSRFEIGDLALKHRRLEKPSDCFNHGGSHEA